MAKTLTEAAAEILNKSRHDSQKMPMEKLAAVRGTAGIGELGNEVDLGGATYENPEGNETGKKTAAHRGVATPPGAQPAADTKENMHKLDGDGGDPEDKRPQNSSVVAVSDQKAGEDNYPQDSNGDHADRGTRNKAEYAHPTMTGEETEVSEEELEEAKKERWENAKKKMKEMSCKEDIDAIFANETLSEEFKTRAMTVFEAAVIARAVAVAEVLEEEILASAEEALSDAYVEIEEQVDTYLNFVVENWVQENQVAIESGLRSEIVEDFISGLKNLFAENYIDIPEEKVDVVESQAEEIEALNAQINEILNNNAELTKKFNESKKTEILSSVCEGLTATQAAKVKTLAEGVEFTTEGEYAGKLETIRESYFATNTVNKDKPSVIQLTEEESPAQVEETTVMASDMSAYVDHLNRINKVY
jgi:hypothetical protein